MARPPRGSQRPRLEIVNEALNGGLDTRLGLDRPEHLCTQHFALKVRREFGIVLGELSTDKFPASFAREASTSRSSWWSVGSLMRLLAFGCVVGLRCCQDCRVFRASTGRWIARCPGPPELDPPPMPRVRCIGRRLAVVRPEVLETFCQLGSSGQNSSSTFALAASARLSVRFFCCSPAKAPVNASATSVAAP